MNASLRLLLLLVGFASVGCSTLEDVEDAANDITDKTGDTDGVDDCEPGEECYDVGGDTSPCQANEDNCFTFTTPSGGTFHSRCTRNLVGWHFESAAYNPTELYYFCKQQMPAESGAEYEYYTFKIYFPAPTVGSYSVSQCQTSIFDGASIDLNGFDKQTLSLSLDDAGITTPDWDVSLTEWDATTRTFKFNVDFALSDGAKTLRVAGRGKGVAEPK